MVGKCKGIHWGSFLSPSPSPSALLEQGKGLQSWEPLVPLAQAGMLCPDKAPMFNSSCASRIPGMHLSFTKSPSFLKRLKLCFQKSYFLIVSLLSPPAPLPIFSPLHSPTHPPLLAVIQLFAVHTWRGSFLLSKPWGLLFILIRMSEGNKMIWKGQRPAVGCWVLPVLLEKELEMFHFFVCFTISSIVLGSYHLLCFKYKGCINRHLYYFVDPDINFHYGAY